MSSSRRKRYSMRCAIYARYSSDLQRDSSIDDQIRQCREYARAQGWSVVEQFVRSDRAISAGSTIGRSSLDQLLKDAERRVSTTLRHQET